MSAEDALPAVLAHYGIPLLNPVRLTGGLINSTWRLSGPEGPAFVLQRLHPSFPGEVNLNFACVTDYLAARGHLVPRLIATRNGAWWVEHDGGVWRLMTFVDGVSHATLPDLAHARTGGAMLGGFHAALREFEGPLPYQRPAVHEPARHRAFLLETLARRSDHPLHATVTALAEAILSALAQEAALPAMPPRFLHGDPKLSNLLFGRDGSPRCLVDLDTLTSAALPFELGDALRSWCNRQAADAPSAEFDLEIFAAALEGYAEAAEGLLLPEEKAAVVSATVTIQLELAMRFAADALNESYFGWDPARFASRGEHNLLRARNQITCARLLSARRTEAEQTVTRIFTHP